MYTAYAAAISAWIGAMSSGVAWRIIGGILFGQWAGDYLKSLRRRAEHCFQGRTVAALTAVPAPSTPSRSAVGGPPLTRAWRRCYYGQERTAALELTYDG